MRFAPGWTQLTDPPLAPRTFALAAAVGDEVFVVGGADYVCAPGDNCPLTSPPFVDGAALDLRTLTWRPIADRPDGPQVIGGPVVADGDLWMLTGSFEPGTERGLLHYDVAADRWDWREAPDTTGYLLAAVDGGLVAYAQGDRPRESGLDSRFDVAAGTWTTLPGDGYVDSTRHLRDSPGGLVLVAWGMPEAVAADSETVTTLRVQLLPPGATAWELLTERELGGYRADVVDGEVIVAPETALGMPGGRFDLATRTWHDLPPVDVPWEDSVDGVAPVVGVLGAERAMVITAGGAVYDVVTDVWVEVPALGHRDWPAITVAGRRVVVVGGQDWSATADGGPLGDAWIWTPG